MTNPKVRNINSSLVNDPLVSVVEGARLLGGVSRHTFRKLVVAGLLPPPVKVGRLSFWRVSDIEAFASRKP